MIVSDIVYLASLGIFGAGLILNCYVTILADRRRDEIAEGLAQIEQRCRDFAEALALWRIGAADEAIELLRPHLTNETVRREVLR